MATSWSANRMTVWGGGVLEVRGLENQPQGGRPSHRMVWATVSTSRGPCFPTWKYGWIQVGGPASSSSRAVTACPHSRWATWPPAFLEGKRHLLPPAGIPGGTSGKEPTCQCACPLRSARPPEVGTRHPAQHLHPKVTLFSCVCLFATPRTAAHQAPLSMGFSRQEY